MEREWKLVAETLPPDGEVVETKVNDEPIVNLLLHRTQWWVPDYSVTAYVIPTHWRASLTPQPAIPPEESEKI